MNVDKKTSEVKKNGVMVWTRKENARKQIVMGNPRMGTRGYTKGRPKERWTNGVGRSVTNR